MNNKELARYWFEEIWNKKNPAVIHQLLHEECVGHTEGGKVVGPAAFERESFDVLSTAFPDIQVTIDGIIGEGDDVVVRWTAVGTNANSLLGIPATGGKITFAGMTWLQFSNGKIVEGWDRWNISGLVNLLQSGQGTATVKAAV